MYIPKVAILSLFWMLFVTQVISQPQKNIKLDTFNQNIQLLTDQLHKNSIEIAALKLEIAKQSSLSDIAGKIIDWSAMLFGLFVIILGFSAWIARNEFNQIYELRRKLEKLLGNSKIEFQNEYKQIQILRNDFEKEKNQSFEVLFPILEGQIFYYQGDNGRAIQSFKDAQKIMPEHPILLNRLNRLLVDRGLIEEAIRNLEIIVNKFPGSAKFRYRLAQAYRRNGQLDIAEKVIKEAMRIENAPFILYEFGTIKLMRGEYAEAEKQLINANRKFISEKGNPKYWVFLNLAICQLLIGQTKDFKKNLEHGKQIIFKFLNRTPNHPNLYGNLGMISLLEQNKNASEYFKRAIELEIPIAITESYQKRINLIRESGFNSFEFEPSFSVLSNYINEKRTKRKEYGG